MSGIRQQRASSAYIAYPAILLDDTILSALGVLWGTRPDENPPKVVMTRADWDVLTRAIHTLPDSRAEHALQFLGSTWQDNPLLERPPGEPDPTPAQPRKFPKKRPSPFAHLFSFSVPAAVNLARAEHEARVSSGHDEEQSLATLHRALEAIRRNALNRVEPNPLPAMEGEDPPSPRELKRMERGERP